MSNHDSCGCGLSRRSFLAQSSAAAAMLFGTHACAQSGATNLQMCWEVEPWEGKYWKDLYPDFDTRVQAAQTASATTISSVGNIGRSPVARAIASGAQPIVARTPAGLSTPTTRNQRGIVNRQKLWDSGSTLRVQFLESPPGDFLQIFREAFAEWTRVACIEFDDSGTGADVRISFVPNVGHYSNIGTDCSNPRNSRNSSGRSESMNIDPTDRGAGREAMKGVVLHEIGHAIGMMHEHQHPAGAIIWNEQAVINYFRSFPNPWTLEEIRFNILDKLTDPDEYDMTPERDIQSIMHYWFRPGLLAPGTLAPTSPNNRISSKDAAFISARLACDSGPSADDDDPTPTAADTDLKPNDAKPLPVPGDAVSAEIDTAGKRHLYEIKVPTSNSFTLIETVDGDDSTPPTPMVLEIYDSSTETFTPEKVKHRSRVTSLSKSLLNGFLAEKLSGGTYFVVARHASGYGTGKYTITWRQTVSASNREDGHGSRRMQNIEGTQEEVGSLVYNDEFDKLREAVNSAQQGWPSISSK